MLKSGEAFRSTTAKTKLRVFELLLPEEYSRAIPRTADSLYSMLFHLLQSPDRKSTEV
jgi:hypothetical protein